MKKLILSLTSLSFVFMLSGCLSNKENKQETVNNATVSSQDKTDNSSYQTTSKYIEDWSEERRKLDGCNYTFLTPSNASRYQYFRGCNKFIFIPKNETDEVKILFDSLTNFDGIDVSLDDINEKIKVYRDSNLYNIYSNDGNVQYNEQFENVNVAGYKALLDKGIAKDDSGVLFNYAIYQLYLGEEKDGVCELLVGSEEMDSDSLAEIGEELIATIQAEE